MELGRWHGWRGTKTTSVDVTIRTTTPRLVSSIPVHTRTRPRQTCVRQTDRQSAPVPLRTVLAMQGPIASGVLQSAAPPTGPSPCLGSSSDLANKVLASLAKPATPHSTTFFSSPGGHSILRFSSSVHNIERPISAIRRALRRPPPARRRPTQYGDRVLPCLYAPGGTLSVYLSVYMLLTKRGPVVRLATTAVCLSVCCSMLLTKRGLVVRIATTDVHEDVHAIVQPARLESRHARR